MRYLHTMVRVSDLDAALDFYCAKLGLKEVRRIENEKGRFTLVFLADAGRCQARRAATARKPDGRTDLQLGREELCRRAQFRPSRLSRGRYLRAVRKADGAGVTINRPPRDGHMAFIRSPDGISIELLQDGHLGPGSPGLRCPTRELVRPIKACRSDVGGRLACVTRSQSRLNAAQHA